MILAVSRFRVRNGMEQQVEAAFVARPHLVDDAAGFLGMETFTDRGDPTVFHLVTRWTDANSFRAWHSSPAHKQSHLGIPKGLKLDAAYTQLVVLDRIEAPDRPPQWTEILADAAPLMAQHVSESRLLHCFVGAADGTVQLCNAAASESLKAGSDEIVGEPIWKWMPQSDAEALKAKLDAGERHPKETFLLNLVDARRHPFSLQCRLDVQPSGFVLVGEPLRMDEDALRDSLIQSNNEMAVLARENERKRKVIASMAAKLEATLQELTTSYWHIRKLQEVLPICMECGDVKSVETGWGDLVDFLKAHSAFFSHGYCPSCLPRVAERFGVSMEELDSADEP